MWLSWNQDPNWTLPLVTAWIQEVEIFLFFCRYIFGLHRYLQILVSTQKYSLASIGRFKYQIKKRVASLAKKKGPVPLNHLWYPSSRKLCSGNPYCTAACNSPKKQHFFARDSTSNGASSRISWTARQEESLANPVADLTDLTDSTPAVSWIYKLPSMP